MDRCNEQTNDERDSAVIISGRGGEVYAKTGGSLAFLEHQLDWEAIIHNLLIVQE
jgi:hypothetical protein